MDVLAKSCPKLTNLLSNKGEVKFVYSSNEKFLGTGFMMQVDTSFVNGIFPVLGDDRILESVFKLLNTSIEVYWEIHDNCPLKDWVKALDEI